MARRSLRTLTKIAEAEANLARVNAEGDAKIEAVIAAAKNEVVLACQKLDMLKDMLRSLDGPLTLAPPVEDQAADLASAHPSGVVKQVIQADTSEEPLRAALEVVKGYEGSRLLDAAVEEKPLGE